MPSNPADKERGDYMAQVIDLPGLAVRTGPASPNGFPWGPSTGGRIPFETRALGRSEGGQGGTRAHTGHDQGLRRGSTSRKPLRAIATRRPSQPRAPPKGREERSKWDAAAPDTVQAAHPHGRPGLGTGLRNGPAMGLRK
ncbi:hypothetical protein CDD83_5717 [Cordyceps sp. RAO-2017]|nr:hypothetical protein CDD83_5717 [Cordyceps sp. RAO-2017]